MQTEELPEQIEKLLKKMIPAESLNCCTGSKNHQRTKEYGRIIDKYMSWIAAGRTYLSRYIFGTFLRSAETVCFRSFSLRLAAHNELNENIDKEFAAADFYNDYTGGFMKWTAHDASDALHNVKYKRENDSNILPYAHSYSENIAVCLLKYSGMTGQNGLIVKETALNQVMLEVTLRFTRNNECFSYKSLEALHFDKLWDRKYIERLAKEKCGNFDGSYTVDECSIVFKGYTLAVHEIDYKYLNRFFDIFLAKPLIYPRIAGYKADSEVLTTEHACLSGMILKDCWLIQILRLHLLSRILEDKELTGVLRYFQSEADAGGELKYGSADWECYFYVRNYIEQSEDCGIWKATLKSLMGKKEYKLNTLKIIIRNYKQEPVCKWFSPQFVLRARLYLEL